MIRISRATGADFPGQGGLNALARALYDWRSMALPFDQTRGARDPRALAILAKTIYRELRTSGYEERDVMMLASELLGAVATEVKGRRGSAMGD